MHFKLGYLLFLSFTNKNADNMLYSKELEVVSASGSGEEPIIQNKCKQQAYPDRCAALIFSNIHTCK